MLSKNIEAASRIITEAAKAGAKMVFLPETSDFLTDNVEEAISLIKPLAQSEFVQGVRGKAKESGVWVSVTVHESVRALPRIIIIISRSGIQIPMLTFTLTSSVLKESRPETRV